MDARIHLIIQYCNDPRPARAAEYDECLRRNLANPAIVAVHNLVEDATQVPEEFVAHPKYKEHRVKRWMTYKDALEYASANLADQTVALANLDIFLDASGTDWSLVVPSVESGVVLCLSRIEWNADGTTFKDPGFEQYAFANSQDVWIFKAPFEVANCDFEIGTLGCDNAFAHRIKLSGRVPINAGGRFKVFHYDRARGKHSANQAEVHKADRAGRPVRRPELEGQYMLPDFDQLKSVDQLLAALKLSDIQRYVVICDVMSQFIKVQNE